MQGESPTPIANLHVQAFAPLPTPRELKAQFPLTEAAAATVAAAREAIRAVLRGDDRRRIIVVGPCSVHDPAAALDYARRLRKLQDQVADRLLLIMRVFLEKPRTTVGWRGLINDPHLDGSFDMAAGLRIARALLLEINGMGLPIATEMLDPISPQYLDDQITLGAIGARTSEAQTHRALASGLSMPIGFKNGTDGGLQVAVNACVSAAVPHSFFGIDLDGRGAVVRTTGNRDSFVILRGGRHGPNYSAEFVHDAVQQLHAARCAANVMIDCSHANAQGDYRNQAQVWRNVLAQMVDGRQPLIGMMLESNLFEGKQTLTDDLGALKYGVSLTDGCVSWEMTESLLREAADALR
jgi:3-deoxy-7-phosphoheptulonate synthase